MDDLEKRNTPILTDESPEIIANTDDNISSADDYSLAVIGYSCAVPGASNIEEYWALLEQGRCGISEFSKEELLEEGLAEEILNKPNYVYKSGHLPQAKYFDAEFFGYSPQEARFMDPQHRVFLEHVYKALESACIIADQYPGRIGVFAGCGQNQYLYKNILFSKARDTWSDFQTMIDNDKDYLATRVAYKLNLRGPAVTLQTACSTSLVALNMAYQSLISYQSDVAVCGAASISIPLKQGYEYMDGSIFSPYGECRAFDEQASGTVFGSGVCTLVVKRFNDALHDGDDILAKITGVSINNDGNSKVSFTAPGIDGQADVIANALESAGVSAKDIGYIEAHGTGTKLGDPIEIAALTKTFKNYTTEKQFCFIGSAKPNIGHLDAAAGMAGVIKTILSMRKGIIPKLVNFSAPNPVMNIENSPFIIATENRKWNAGKKKIAGVSSFGIGGTNAHVIIEEVTKDNEGTPSPLPAIIPVTGKCEESLQGTIDSIGNYLANNDIDIKNAIFTQLKYRKHYDIKGCIYFSGQDYEKFSYKKRETELNEIVFMFSGQGSQYQHMGRMLYDWHPQIRVLFDECFSILRAFCHWDPLEVLFGSKVDLSQTEYTQPLLFVFEYVIAKFYIHIGILPNVLVGHSLGELTAACIGGGISLKDALFLTVERGKLLQNAPAGKMAAVFASREKIEPLLPFGVSIAGDNSPMQTIISGSESEVVGFIDDLRMKNYKVTEIAAHTGFHSPLMDKCIPGLNVALEGIIFSPLQLPMYSNITGDLLSEGYLFSAEYWVRHLCSPVNFRKSISSILNPQYKAFIEIGPGSVLAGLVSQILSSEEYIILPGIKRQKNGNDHESKNILRAFGELYSYGYSVKWDMLTDLSNAKKTYLPGYEFKRDEHWIVADSDERVSCKSYQTGSAAETKENNDQDNYFDSIENIRSIWSDLLGYPEINDNLDFFGAGGDSLLAAQLVQNVNSRLGTNISLGYIFSNPVFSEFIAHSNWTINGNSGDSTYIFNLNQSQKAKKIYCVLGVQIYQELAKELEDIAQCYGMYIPEEEMFFAGHFADNSLHVEDLASEYKALIIKHNGLAPVTILGLSFGGLVGYELSKQLVKSGIDVEQLIMLDSLLPSGIRKRHLNWSWIQLRLLFNKGIRDRLNLLFNSYSQNRHQDLKINTIMDLRLENYERATKLFEKAYSGTIYTRSSLLLKANDTLNRTSSGYSILYDYGWKKYISKDLLIQKVPGDHLTILKSPHVQKTAASIKAYLSEQRKEGLDMNIGKKTAVSAEVPDWNREKINPFLYNPGKKLLHSIRSYQRSIVKRSLLWSIVRVMSKIRHRWWSIVTGADIQLNTQIEGGLLIPHPNGIVIHPDVIIGPNCLLFQQVTLGVGPLPGVPVLDGHVDVGAGAKVLGGVKIGAHAKIGANAVVITDVPSGATAVGVPARILAYGGNKQ